MKIASAWISKTMSRLFTAILSMASVAHAAPSFKAGTAQVVITPPAGLTMHENVRATGTLDPLFARVLVLETGDKRVALVTLDLGRTFPGAWLDQLRTAARVSSQVGKVIVTASGTHSGPSISETAKNETAAWEHETFDKIAGAIRQACGQLAPARIGSDHGEHYARGYIGFNRRQVHLDGTVSMLWSNPAATPTTPIDPVISVVRVDDAKGQPMAILVGYACEPVVLGNDNSQYSADYVGVMLRAVATQFDSNPLCFFLPGGDGDILPLYASTPIAQGGEEKLEWTGEQLAAQAVEVAKRIQTSVPSVPSIDVAEDTLTVPLRWAAQSFTQGAVRGRAAAISEDESDLLSDASLRVPLSLSTTTLLINKKVAIVTMPGGPFVDFQIDLHGRCPVTDCVLVGHTDGFAGYMRTIVAASQGGYGAGDSYTIVAVGTGERMIDHAVIHLHEMRGDLKPLPLTHHENSLVHLLD